MGRKIYLVQCALRNKRLSRISGDLAFAPLYVWPPLILSVCRPVSYLWNRSTGLVRRGFLPALTVFGSIFWNHLQGSFNRRSENQTWWCASSSFFLLPSLPHFSHFEGCGLLNHQGCVALCSCLNMKWGSLLFPNWTLAEALSPWLCETILTVFAF